MSDFGQILRRHFVAIATARYSKDPSFWDLPGVIDEVAAIRNWLTSKELGDRSFTPAYEELAADPTQAQVLAAFQDPPVDKRWGWADAAFVYITGHGKTKDGRRHFLVLKETDGTRLSATGISTADLFEWLADTKIEYLLVIIDACFAGQVAEQISPLAKKNWLILPSATKAQQAQLGALTGAISQYLARGQEYNRDSPHLPVGMFVNALNDFLAPQRVEKIYKGGDHDEHVCLPNPHYEPSGEVVNTARARRALALPKDALTLHNRIRGRLPASDGSPGWLFTGRAQLMQALIGIAQEPGVTMVTGSAGSGKTTVLSRLVTLCDPIFRQEHADELVGVPANLLPPLGTVDVAVSARGRSSLELLVRICQVLAVELPPGLWMDLVAHRDALAEFLQSRPTLVTVVIDALDEVNDPYGFVRNVLIPLRRAQPDRLCLLIGVRSPGGDRPPVSEMRASEDPLPELMASAMGAQSVRVDHDPFLVSGDIATFAQNILTNTPNSPYQDAASATAAEAIQRAVSPSYLLAKVAAESLASRTAVVAPDDPAWLSALRQGLFGVFRDDLHASIPSASDRRRGVALLRAVAYARGPGLPWRRVWPRVANAVDADDGEGRDYGDIDVEWLLKSRLNAYLVTDRQDDLTVYRLSHDLLRQTLRYRWRDLLKADERAGEGGTETVENDDEIVEARIALELRSQAPFRPVAAGGQAPSAYVRRHLAEHALAGGVLDEQHLPTPFLPYLDLARLRAAIGAAPGRRRLDRTLPLLPVIRQVTHLWDWGRPARNAAAIEMWAALSRTELREWPGGPWQVLWAVRPPDTSEVLGLHNAQVRAAAAADLFGTAVAVTGGTDGMLHIWDLSADTAYSDPINTLGGAVQAVTIARLPDGRAVAVTGGADGTIRSWDMRSGRPVTESLPVSRRAIVAITAAVLVDHRVVVAAADEAGTISSWDLIAGKRAGVPLTDGPGMALGLATARIGQRVLGLATGLDSGLRLWDLSTGVPVGERLTDHPRAQRSQTGTLLGGPGIAAVVLDGQNVAITGDGDGLLLWDVRDPAPIDRRLTGNDGRVRSLAAIRMADGRVVATTGGNSAVRMWDLTSDGPVGELLAGHSGSVEAVAVIESADGAVVVSGSRDKTVRVWYESGGMLSAAQLFSAQVEIVEAVATVRLPGGKSAAISCSGAVIQLWDMESGALLLPPLAGHDSPAVSVVAAQLPAGRTLILAGGWDGTICSWSAADGSSAGHGPSGHQGPVQSLTAASRKDGQAVVVTGGWDHDIRLWDPVLSVPTGVVIRGHTDIVVAVASAGAPDGRTFVISGSRDGHVLVHDLDAHLHPGTSAPRPLVDVDTGEAVAALTTTVLPDGQAVVVVGGESGTVRLLDMITGQTVGKPWTACDGPVAAVAAARRQDDGSVLVFTGGEESLIQAWDIRTRRPAGEALPAPGAVRAMAYQAEPQSLVVGGAGVAVVRLRHDVH